MAVGEVAVVDDTVADADAAKVTATVDDDNADEEGATATSADVACVAVPSADDDDVVVAAAAGVGAVVDVDAAARRKSSCGAVATNFAASELRVKSTDDTNMGAPCRRDE